MARPKSFERIDVPLLADFHPKGEVSRKYGVWLGQASISDRATVLIGKDGTVPWSESVGPSGARQPLELRETVGSLVQATPTRPRA
ncbi:MAG: hypothetical protein R3D98_16265 [Candidatus Krumholzibacteriia bacterium]